MMMMKTIAFMRSFLLLLLSSPTLSFLYVVVVVVVVVVTGVVVSAFQQQQHQYQYQQYQQQSWTNGRTTIRSTTRTSSVILSSFSNNNNSNNNIFSNSNTANRKVQRILVGNPKTSTYTISQIGCGTWSWGNRLLYNYNMKQDIDIYEAYRYIRNAGITLFDTADSYGTLDLNGRAEILLGQFERQYQQEILYNQQSSNNIGLLSKLSQDPKLVLQEQLQQRMWWEVGPYNNNNNNNNWNWNLQRKQQQQQQQNQQQQIATKLAPYPWRLTRGSIVKAAQSSLQRIQQDQLAIVQLHWSTSKYLPYQEQVLWDGIMDVYEQQLCNGIGVSNYGPKQLLKFDQYIKETRGYNNINNNEQSPLMVAQIQYSLLTYQTSQYMNQACNDIDCTLISYSPLCLGLLTGKYTLDNLPPVGNPRRQLFRELLPSAQLLLQTLDAISKEYNTTPSQIAIYWTMTKGTVPIPGCRTIEQAISNVNAATSLRLPPDVIAELDYIALNIKKPMIQNIFQTE